MQDAVRGESGLTMQDYLQRYLVQVYIEYCEVYKIPRRVGFPHVKKSEYILNTKSFKDHTHKKIKNYRNVLLLLPIGAIHLFFMASFQ